MVTFKGTSKVALALIASSMTQTCRGEETSTLNARVLYPNSKSITVYDGDSVVVQYTSDIADASLVFWCQQNGNQRIKKGVIQNAQPYNGTEVVNIAYGIDSDACWFNLRDNSQPTVNGPNSSGFKLLKESRESHSTLSLETPMTTAVQAMSTASIPATATSVITTESVASVTLEESIIDLLTDSISSTPTIVAEPTSFLETISTTTTSSTETPTPTTAIIQAEPSKGEGLSTEAKIGLGVGISVGAIGIATLLAALWVVKSRRRAEGAETKRNEDSDSQELYGDVPKNTSAEEVQELPLKDEIRRGPQHELPG